MKWARPSCQKRRCNVDCANVHPANRKMEQVVLDRQRCDLPGGIGDCADILLLKKTDKLFSVIIKT